MKTRWWLLLILLADLIVLWRLLLPGYVLTLDMVMTPTIHPALSLSGRFLNALPFVWILRGLSAFVPVWMGQKGILLALMTCLLVLPYRFLPIPKNSATARFWAAAFYLLNPLVYERFLAGHWTFLFGYAFLPPIVSNAISLYRSPDARRAVKLALWLLLLGIFSLHLFVMSMILAAIFVAVTVWRHPRPKAFLKTTALIVLIIAIAAAYWTVPALLTSTSPLDAFNPSHWQSFVTSGDSARSVIWNILTLRGFWLEHEPWIHTFRSVSDPAWLWIIAWSIIGALIVTGAVCGIWKKETRFATACLIVLAVTAFVFSCGIAPTPFAALNRRLFEHVSFWRGFRDSQKWSAWLALAFAILGGWGASKLRTAVSIAAAFVAVTVIGRLILFGFSGQLTPVQYPQGWMQADAMLRQDPQCLAVFFPWHEYMTLAFANNRLIANPARTFFSCRVLTARQMELGQVEEPSSATDRTIQGILTTCLPPQTAISRLRRLGITNILFSPEIMEDTAFNYTFLQDPSLSLQTFDGLTPVVLTPN